MRGKERKQDKDTGMKDKKVEKTERKKRKKGVRKGTDIRK